MSEAISNVPERMTALKLQYYLCLAHLGRTGMGCLDFLTGLEVLRSFLRRLVFALLEDFG